MFKINSAFPHAIPLYYNRATDEYRQSLLKQATKQTEDVKASIRRFRQNAMADLKKQKDAIPKDDMKKLENEVCHLWLPSSPLSTC